MRESASGARSGEARQSTPGFKRRHQCSWNQTMWPYSHSGGFSVGA